MNKYLLRATVLVVPTFYAGLAISATDGATAKDGAASTGTSDINMVKQVSVQITNLDDLNLGTHAQLSADEVATDDVCVFASNVTYFVTVSSANNAFQMVGTDPANVLNYSVSWGATPLTYGQQIATAQTGDATDAGCGGTPNASYSVTVAQADFNGVSYDTYSDTLIVSIIPE